MPIVATMRGHRSLALLDRSHYDPFEPCAPGEFRVFESVGCLQLLLFCRHCCNSDGRFATLFEICGYDCCDSSIEICLATQSIYLVLQRGCWGWARNPGPWLFWTADTWPVTFDVGKVWLAVTTLNVGGGRAVGTTTIFRVSEPKTDFFCLTLSRNFSGCDLSEQNGTVCGQ